MEENEDIIKKAYKTVQENLNVLSLQENEKHAILLLVEKLIAYYDKRLSIMAKKGIDINSNDERVLVLKSLMTDILVDVNNVIKGGIDVYYFISIINKKLNDKEIYNMIKSKKK